MKFPLIKDNNDQRSVSLTMLIVSFTIISLWLLASIFEKIGGISIREFSSGDVLAFFMPICALYFGKRWMTKATTKAGSKKTTKKTEETSEEENA